MMKQIYTLIALAFTFICSLNAQSESVDIRFIHMVGDELLDSNLFFETPSGTEVKVERFSWYVSHPTFIMEDETEVPCAESYFLFRMDRDKQVLSGMVEDASLIKTLRFYAGVDSRVNHLDPSLYPPTHPLAHQNPTMHWGWVSGYIFNAFEGKTKNQNGVEESFFMHSIGNVLYTAIDVPVHPRETEDGKWEIVIHVDILRLIGDKNIHGLIAMGEFEDNKYLFQQMKDAEVFYDPNLPSSSTTSYSEDVVVQLFPNPITAGGMMYVSTPTSVIRQVSIVDAIGRTITVDQNNSSNAQFVIPNLAPGLIFLKLEMANGQQVLKKIMVGY
jgi:hypothetical protein